MAHVETGRAARVDLPQSKNPTSAAIEPRAQALTRAGVEHVVRPAANLRAEAATAPATIRITIGRVDVRALMPQSPPVRRKPAAPP
ncbi:MAG TPA: hypothetical protein VLA73_03000, partial [Burkholderiales bacterium]|nr:hypothetical protein [Burkholderiales bacterium]